MVWIEWTWEDCREKYRMWGTVYEKLMQSFPENNFPDTYHKISANEQDMMNNMLALIDALEASPNFPHVTKLVSHQSLRLGLPHYHAASVLNVWIDWYREIGKYHVGLYPFGREEEIEISLEEAVATIKHYLLRLQEIENEHQNNTD